MHRSGTSMMCNFLEQMGLFIGQKRRKNLEAVFFQEMNKWLLFQANTTWDFPSNFKYVDEDYFEQVERVINLRLASAFRHQYLGKIKSLKYSSLRQLDFPWAWKDPVNTISLEVWMRLFPNAKIVYVYRNPIDVAQSLKKREIKRREKRALTAKQKLRERVLSHQYKYNQSYYIQSLERGFDLWKEYIQLNEQAFVKYPNQIFKIQYEQFLEEPYPILKSLNEFCELNAQEGTFEKINQQIDADRKYNFIKHPELCEFYKSIQEDEVLNRMNYGSII